MDRKTKDRNSIPTTTPRELFKLSHIAEKGYFLGGGCQFGITSYENISLVAPHFKHLLNSNISVKENFYLNVFQNGGHKGIRKWIIMVYFIAAD